MLRKLKALFSSRSKKSKLEEPLFKINRRKEVLPGVWLGVANDLQDEEFMKRENIKFLQNVSTQTWFKPKQEKKEKSTQKDQKKETTEITALNVAFYKLDPSEQSKKEKNPDNNKKEEISKKEDTTTTTTTTPTIDAELKMSNLPGVFKVINNLQVIHENYILTKTRLGGVLLCSLSDQDNGPIFSLALYLIYTFGWTAQKCLEFIHQQADISVLIDKLNITKHRFYTLLSAYAQEVREFIQASEESAQKLAETNHAVSLPPHAS